MQMNHSKKQSCRQHLSRHCNDSHHEARPDQSHPVVAQIILLSVFLFSLSSTHASAAVDRLQIEVEAASLVNLSYLMTPEEFLTILDQRKAMTDHSPAQFEATLAEWIRQLRKEPEEPGVLTILESLISYRPLVLVPDHEHRTLVPKYNITREIEATLNHWHYYRSHQIARDSLIRGETMSVARQLRQSSHKQELAGIASALTQSLDRNPSNELMLLIMQHPSGDQSGVGLATRVVADLSNLELKRQLAVHVLDHGSSLDRSVVLRQLDSWFGDTEASDIRTALMKSRRLPASLVSQALIAQMTATPGDVELIIQAIDWLDHPEIGASAAFALDKADSDLSRQLLLTHYPEATHKTRQRTRLLMNRRQDSLALMEIKQMDDGENRQ